MYFKNIDDKLLIEASRIMYDADEVDVQIPEYQEVTEHAVRRFIQRATRGSVKDQDRLLCNAQIGKILNSAYKRDNYMGKTYDAKYGTTYWYRGCTDDGKVKYLVPQNTNGCIKTIFNWGFNNDKVKFLKSRIIQLTEKLTEAYTNDGSKNA